MSSGYDAALLLLALLLPGAFAAWGFERHVQRYGRRLKDWLLRLAGLSAVCLALGAWPLHWVVSSYWDDFTQGRALPWYVFLAPVAYLAVPAAVGIRHKTTATVETRDTRCPAAFRDPRTREFSRGGPLVGRSAY